MPVTDGMPTAARLIGAICLAVLGWVGSDMIRPLMPPHTAFGWFNWVNLAIGAACGWFIIGSRVGQGYVVAISTGLTGLAGLVFWGLFAQSFNEMLGQSLKKEFKGPIEALIGIFDNSVEYGQYLVDAQLIGALVGGGILCGLIAEFAGRRWS